MAKAAESLSELPQRVKFASLSPMPSRWGGSRSQSDGEISQASDGDHSYVMTVEEAGQHIVGIIGMGVMGTLYAETLAGAGFLVLVCDKPSETERLLEKYGDGTRNVFPCAGGHLISRVAHMVVYSTETATLPIVAKLYGPSTRPGAIVAGQCSVKAPEIEALEAHLPKDVPIVSVHSLHAGDISTKGQTLVFMPYRCNLREELFAKAVFGCFESKMITMTVHEHDEITADTQVVTHLALMSMGLAWFRAGTYPWEDVSYVGGIENIKVLSTLRVFSAKAHIYESLAMQNPCSNRQVAQYARSVSDLFKLMLTQDRDTLYARIMKGREFVFGLTDTREERVADGGSVGTMAATKYQESLESSNREGRAGRPILLLPDTLLDEFALGGRNPGSREQRANLNSPSDPHHSHTLVRDGPCPSQGSPLQSRDGPSIERRSPSNSPSCFRNTPAGGQQNDSGRSSPLVSVFLRGNSHLSLLAMVDSWYQLGVNPYGHLVCVTPPFRFRLGIAEYLYHRIELLEQSLEVALYDPKIRGDDMEFFLASNLWAETIRNKDSQGYLSRFLEISHFFEERLADAREKFSRLNRKIIQLHALQDSPK
mmetsp:Transcript_3511/g.9518  ORF Transcript_3511/g.9518 Transcript_3511/m.9518 type:complete len:596 (+) Transcript_3511:144-1931(+)